MTARPWARRLDGQDLVRLAAIGERYCCAARCREAPAWVIWHYYTWRGREMVAEHFKCEEHTAAYRRRHPDTEIHVFEESR